MAISLSDALILYSWNCEKQMKALLMWNIKGNLLVHQGTSDHYRFNFKTFKNTKMFGIQDLVFKHPKITKTIRFVFVSLTRFGVRFTKVSSRKAINLIR